MTGRFRRWWNEFFFTREVPYGMALVRITLPLVLLVGVIPRWQHVREIYSSDGATTPIWVSYGSSPLLPEFSAPVAVGLNTVLIFCLVTASLGWRTRLSLWLATVLYAGFGLLDMVSTLTKYTVLASHVLMLLALSDCGAVWSVDAWLRRDRRRPILEGRAMSAVWPKRLLQLLLAICYLGAAFTKMHTPEYFSGDQMLFWLLANMNFENRVGEYLSLYPPASVCFAYIVILWEVLFIALIWHRPWRGIMLGIGVVFHIMTAFTLGLLVFPLLCLSMYLVFLEESDIQRLAVTVRTFRRGWKPATTRRIPQAARTAPRWLSGRPSIAAFAIIAMAVSVVGVEVEHRMDVYQKRGPSGPLALEPMEDAAVAAMLGPPEPIRPQDLFFSFDLGTTLMGGLLADRRVEFETGEQAVLQCQMNPPHPDMWVELLVCDAENRPLRRYGQIVPRESLRSNFNYQFDESLTPGEYAFVLVYDDQEISRRHFHLVSQPAETRPVAGMTASHETLSSD